MDQRLQDPAGVAPPDWRGLCEELLEALDGWQLGGAPPEDDAEQELIDRARLALAQSEPEVAGPSDEEVEAWADNQGFIKGSGDHPCGFWIDDGDVGAFARAVLARWGRPAPAPAGEAAKLAVQLRTRRFGPGALDLAADLLEQLSAQAAPVPAGEVGELVEFLRIFGDELMDEHGGVAEHDQLTRAADLLEQRQAAPVPVAIPGEEYHDDMGPVTWWRLPVNEPPWVGTPGDSDWPGYHTHFTPAPPEPLNAHALPLPTPEPQP